MYHRVRISGRRPRSCVVGVYFNLGAGSGPRARPRRSAPVADSTRPSPLFSNPGYASAAPNACVPLFAGYHNLHMTHGEHRWEARMYDTLHWPFNCQKMSGKCSIGHRKKWRTICGVNWPMNKYPLVYDTTRHPLPEYSRSSLLIQLSFPGYPVCR